MVPIATASLKHCVDNRRKRKPIVIITMNEKCKKEFGWTCKPLVMQLVFIDVIVLY